MKLQPRLFSASLNHFGALSPFRTCCWKCLHILRKLPSMSSENLKMSSFSKHHFALFFFARATSAWLIMDLVNERLSARPFSSSKNSQCAMIVELLMDFG